MACPAGVFSAEYCTCTESESPCNSDDDADDEEYPPDFYVDRIRTVTKLQGFLVLFCGAWCILKLSDMDRCNLIAESTLSIVN